MRRCARQRPTPEPQRREEPRREESRREEPGREMATEDEAREREGAAPQAREWVSPFEPLSIRTADYERVPVLDGPMMVSADAVPHAGGRCCGVTQGCAALARPHRAVPTLVPEPIDRSTRAARAGCRMPASSRRS